MRRIFAFVLVLLLLATATAQERPAKAKAAALPDSIVAERDVEYAKAGDVSLKLDVYRPKAESAKPRPCIVWIHGGGWQGGSKSSGAARLASHVASGDYVGVSVGYRLTDVASWPAQIHDCKAAIRTFGPIARSSESIRTRSACGVRRRAGTLSACWARRVM